MASSKDQTNDLKNHQYKAVKIIDIQPNTPLEFDTYVFLPANNKHIIFSRAGEDMTSDQVQKLQKNRVFSLSVKSDELPKFYEYTARVLRDYHQSSSLSETEKRERLRQLVQDLFLGAPKNGQDGEQSHFEKELMETCGKIVENYVLNTSSAEVYKKITTIVGEQADTYSHAANVSTLASLFSIGVGQGTPEHLALAGLLYKMDDSTSISENLQPKLKQHPQDASSAKDSNQRVSGSQLVRTQKLILPDVIMKSISQVKEHAQAVPGNKKASAKIHIEAQILAIADRFDDLMSLQPGKARLSPHDAISVVEKEFEQDPDPNWNNPSLIREIDILVSGN